MTVVFPRLASCFHTNCIQRFVTTTQQTEVSYCVFHVGGLGVTPLEKPQLMSTSWAEDSRGMGEVSRATLRNRLGGGVTVLGAVSVLAIPFR